MFSPKELDLPRGWPGRIDGDRVVQLAAQTLQVYFISGGGLREHAEYPLADVDLRAPVLYPPSIRVFNGSDFAFANTAAIHGPDDEIPFPEGSSDLRSVPSVAGMIGADGAIGGFTAANAWTAPDLPGVKSRDFALSIGPVSCALIFELRSRFSGIGNRVASGPGSGEPWTSCSGTGWVMSKSAMPQPVNSNRKTRRMPSP